MKKYRDRDWLYQKYIVEDLTCKQISDICDCDESTIYSHLKKKNIPIKRHNRVSFVTDSKGYNRVEDRSNGTCETCAIHQLLMIHAGADPYKVFSDGEYQVHHKNTHKIDNRVENLELLSASEHAEKHAESFITR